MPKMLPTVPVHDGSLFLWSKGNASTDVSELGREKPWARLWDDACDVGFKVKSHRTGAVHAFVLVEHKKDDEGDTLRWQFASYDLPNPTFITVYND